MTTNNDTIIVTLPRIVPNGGVNPNTKKPYKNMEESLEKYLTQQRSTGYVPLYKYTITDTTCITQINPIKNIVGRVMTVTDTSATVEIIDKDYFMRLTEPAIDIHVLINTMRYTDDLITIDRVIGICLTNKKVKLPK